MNDYEYRYIIEEKNRQHEWTNRNAWKYEALYKYRPYFSYRRLFQFIFKRNKVQVECTMACCCS